MLLQPNNLSFFWKTKKNGIKILIAEVIGLSRDRIFKSKLIEILKAENLFIETNDIVDCFDGFLDKSVIKKVYESKIMIE